MPASRAVPPQDVSVSGRQLAARKWKRRKVLMLPLERLRPVIRIAHRMKGALRIPQRIILDHELVHIVRGEGNLRLGAEVTPFRPGDVLFIPPFLPHTFDSPARLAGEHLAIHFDFAPGFPASSAALTGREPYEVQFARGFSIPPRIGTTQAELVSPGMERIVSFFKREEVLARLRAEALLLDLVIHLFQLGAAPAPVSNPSLAPSVRVRVERALAHVEAHLSERMTPADLARAAGLSVSHFSKLFRRWSTLSPGEFVLRRRVDEARKLLGDPSLSVKEVAARCGFEDPYYFSKAFRRIDGLPPSHFREALLAGTNTPASVDSSK